ncbi:MAG: hypothetical protein PF501_09955 [Salinisphaera sp.]|jgi:hypothetical protein|nr:hypothetical protein [Salinisphaera sp.]
MTWAGATTGSPVTLSTAYASLGTVTTTNPADIVHLQIEAVFQASPASNIQYRLLSSPDGVKFDTIPITAALISNAGGGTKRESIIGLQGGVAYEVQAALDASGDTADTAALTYNVG